MGSTNKTDIGLSQFLENDKPAWINDYNEDMRVISANITSLHNVTATVIAGRLDMHDTQIAKLTDGLSQAETNIASVTASVASNRVEILNLDNKYSALDSREMEHYNALSGSVDTATAAVKTLTEKQTYFEQNMNRVEDNVIVNTASIAKMQVRMAAVENAAGANTTDIDGLKTDVSNLQAETDTLETSLRQLSSSVSTNTSNIEENKNSIDSLSTRTEALEAKSADIDTNTNNISTLTQRTETLEQHAKTEEENVDALQRKTANMTDGVDVPFGFGETAGGARGWKDASNVVQPFITPQEYADILDDYNNLMADVAALQAKLANVIDGVKIPYSLGIADGGAYGYIKNGEYGVTPFVTSEDVKSIVDIKPIEAQIQTLSENVSTASETAQKAKAVTDDVHLADGCDIYVHKNSFNHAELQARVSDSEFAALSAGNNNGHTVLYLGIDRAGKNVAPNDFVCYLPFSFGIDDSGNYGYRKQGADAVTPFLSKIPLITTTTNNNQKEAESGLYWDSVWYERTFIIPKQYGIDDDTPIYAWLLNNSYAQMVRPDNTDYLYYHNFNPDTVTLRHLPADVKHNIVYLSLEPAGKGRLVHAIGTVPSNATGSIILI